MTQLQDAMGNPGGKLVVLRDVGGVLPDDWINDVRIDRHTVDVLTQRDGLLHIVQGPGPDRVEIWRFKLSTSPSAMAHVGGAVVFGTNGAGLAVALPIASGGAHLFTFGPAQGLGSRTVAALDYDAARDLLLVGGDGSVDRIEGASIKFRSLNSEEGARP